MPNRFRVDPWLAADSIALGDFPLCAVRLNDDARFPWLVLIPRRSGLVEIIDLPAPDRAQLMEEIARASDALKSTTHCHKLNVAALGNVVHQLHVHVIARFADDAAGANAVLGQGARVPYQAAARDALAEKLRRGLGFA